jgi:predicted HTH transcriptional regulator
MGIDEKTIRAALLKGERITLEAKRAEKDVTKSVWERHSAFANYKKPVFIMMLMIFQFNIRK